MNDASNTVVDSGGETIRVEQTPGSILRKLREDAGLSYVAVGAALHLTAHYVKALESDEYGKLPGLTFVKGYLRSYARLMKADVDAVMVSFEKHIAGLVDAGQRTQQVQRSRRRHDQALRWAIAMSVILVLGIAGGWWFKGKGDTASSARPASPTAAATNIQTATGVSR